MKIKLVHGLLDTEFGLNWILPSDGYFADIGTYGYDGSPTENNREKKDYRRLGGQRSIPKSALMNYYLGCLLPLTLCSISGKSTRKRFISDSRSF